MFRELKKRIIIYTTVIGAAVFLLLFSVIYAINFKNMTESVLVLIEVNLTETPPEAQKPNFRNQVYIITVTASGEIIPSNFPDVQAEQEITEKVLEEGAEGEFYNNGNYYVFGSRRQPNGNMRYAVADATIAYSSAHSLQATLFFAYLACVLLVFVASIPIADRFCRPAEEAWRKQKTMVQNASHELKTPLTIIGANLAAMENETDEESKRKWLANVSMQTARLSSLINEMLELARLDEGSEEVKREKVDFSTTVKGIMLSFEAGFFERKIRYIEEVEDCVEINTDKNLLEKLILCLVENAYKYTEEGGGIKVRLMCQKKEIIFSVENSGGGISEENLSKVFDRFYRDESMLGGQSGFGLGLSIAKSIADKLEGSLSAESKQGEFTRFTFTLRD